MNASEVSLVPSSVAPASRLSRAVTGRLVFGVQLMIAVAAVVAGFVGWVLFDSEPSIWVLNGVWLVGELLPGVIAFALAGLVLLRFPAAAAVGWTMLICAGLLGMSVLSAGLFIESFERGWALDVPFTASILLGNLGLLIAIYVLPQLYPDGLLSGWVWRTLFIISLVLTIATQGVNAAANWGSYQVPYAEPVSANLLRLLNEVSWPSGLVIATATLVERIRRGPGLVRRQVGLFALIWVISIGVQEFVGRELGSESYVMAYLVGSWPPVVVTLVALAIVLFRMYDIRPIVRRAAVYGLMALALTAVFAAVYAAVVLALSSLLVDERWRWVAVMAAVVVVLAADPLRRRLRAGLERRFLGSRGDPLRSLARLDALVSAGSADEQTVYRRIAGTVLDAVRAPGVELAVYRAQDAELVALAGAEPVDPLIVPLLHRSERLGELRVAARTPGEVYGRADRALLDRLASQAAAIVYGLRRDRDIDTLRQDAIEAMAEQRMVLGRDLHDGLAPLLAGAGLTADALRRGMPPGSRDAEEAGRLAGRLRNAATEVRRIAHDLQPTGGGTDGLTGLVADYVASLSGPSVPEFRLALDDLRDRALPATVELGLSRVALEAINNVIRHAHASHVSVTLRIDGGQLELVVTDDGVGIGRPYVSGLGITSMRSRVEALNGVFGMAPAAGGGTRLSASVPVGA